MLDQFFLGTIYVWTQKKFGPRILLNQSKLFWNVNFLTNNYFWPQTANTKFFGPNIFQTQIFWTQYFVGYEFYRYFLLDPNCTWEWSLTLALCQLVFISCYDVFILDSFLSCYYVDIFYSSLSLNINQKTGVMVHTYSHLLVGVQNLLAQGEMVGWMKGKIRLPTRWD